MQTENAAEQTSLFDHACLCGKTYPEHSALEPLKVRTSESSLRKSCASSAIPYLSLDLTPGYGNLLGESFWEILSPSRGGCWMLNTGPAPRSGEGESTLSQILQAQAHPKYYLSKKACRGFLRRAKERNNKIPPQLEWALKVQSGILPNTGYAGKHGVVAFASNQRDEVRDLHGRTGTLTAQRFVKQQTYVADFCGGADSGENQLKVYESHGIAGRCTGPYKVAPTLSTAPGSIPLVSKDDDPHQKSHDIDTREQDTVSIIRRLTPLEFERLQGFPDGWTDIPGASDSARYRALGNSVAIPCVEYVLHGIALVMQEQKSEMEV